MGDHSAVIEPFRVIVAEDDIADLRQRLERTRWPDQLPGTEWDYGTNLTYLRELCDYWKDQYDWRGFERRLNVFPQYVTVIAAQRVHFIHARSPVPDAKPLIISHGWPGSVVEFLEVIGPLIDPAAHGGDPADAFHVIAPSLPGFGFSGPTHERGFTTRRIAAAFAQLMERLGYQRYFIQGGDWGAMIGTIMAAEHPARVIALHLNLIMANPPDPQNPAAGLDADGLADLARSEHVQAHEMAYQLLQATKPQTLAYGLMDSPAGLAGWIVEKFRAWSDCGGDVERSFTKDQLLDNIGIYWLTGTINSSARLYYEDLGPGRFQPFPRVAVPTAHARYPAEHYRPPREWAEPGFNLVRWNKMPRGGHFAAMEEPELFVADVRDFFRGYRSD